MASGGLVMLLRKQFGCRYKMAYDHCLVKYESRILEKKSCKFQKNSMSSTANMSSISSSVKMLSAKNNPRTETGATDNNRVEKLKELNENLRELGNLVENEIKSAKAVILDDKDDEIDESVTSVKVSNSLRTVEIYGTPDSNQSISMTPCPGCGAKLHCKDPGIPGYIASQIFLSKRPADLKTQPCQRCHILKTKKVALDLSVSVDKYGPITREIRRHSALIVLLVDMTDPSNSFHTKFKELSSLKRPIFVIGNKIDLIPKDSEGYLKHLKNALVSISDQHGFNQASNVIHFDLISAKTGFGVEKLISKMLSYWKLRGNVFIIGCTNSGKSTLYNSLIASDFCRSSASEVLSRATTSIWPGTTLNLLKFPIVNPKPSRLLEREKRLKRQSFGGKMEEELYKSIMNKNVPNLHSPLSTTFLSPTQESLSQSSNHAIVPSYSYESLEEDPLHSHVGMKGAAEYLSLKKMRYDDSTFKFWCFDTPGLVNQEQVVNLLSPEELSMSLVTKKQIKPRTFIIKPLQTVFVSGLGRIDYLEGRDDIHFTFYTSPLLPIHTLETSQAEDFYKQNIGSQALGIPIESSNDPRNLPPLEGREMKVVGRGMKEAAADVVLSSIGWVSVSPRENQPITLRAYTPNARGLSLRQHPLIRYPINNMGKRIQGTNRYSYKKVELEMID